MSNEVNNKIVKNENGNDSTVFLTKFKILSKSRSIKAIKKLIFLIINTKNVFSLLR